jgi:uncharacterized protein YbjT (DUF2867 family)
MADAAAGPTADTAPRTILVTGATGYVGGRLVPRLLAEGHTVRVYVRTPEKLESVPWRSQVTVVQGDLTDGESLQQACQGVDVVFYLVHSMASGTGFEERETDIARIVTEACSAAGVGRIVYLGGLHPRNVPLSAHMRSRTEVGSLLLAGRTDAVVLQAGVIIGSGSASFEMIRHLADVLPVMPAPSWVRNRIEPIAIRDVLYYLVSAATVPGTINRTFDVGSREVLQYAEMMQQYALLAGLGRRRVLALPLPAPLLAGHWVSLVTPIPLAMAKPLVQSLQQDAVSNEQDIDAVIPPPKGGLTGFRRAVELALEKERTGQIETSWATAGGYGPEADPLPSDPDWAGHAVLTDDRTHHFDVGPEAMWQVIEGLGGQRGWYSLPLAWVVRGLMDKVVGGAGLARGRRHPDRLAPGDPVDWWRVERIERGHQLLLRAEMRAPGRAWLEFTLDPAAGGGTIYRQRAIFFPRGLSGRLYWLGVLPFHAFIFPSMSRNIAAQAARLHANRTDRRQDGRPETVL